MPDSNYRHGNENKQFYCLIKPPSALIGSILANLKVTPTNKLSSVINLNPNCAIEKLKRFLSIAPSFSWGFINIMDWL
jgi:hypothetical protein